MSECQSVPRTHRRAAEFAEWDTDTLRALAAETDILPAFFYEDELAAIRGAEKPLPMANKETDPEFGSDSGSGVPIAHVRMVQLFLTTDTFPEFTEMVADLQEKYGTQNPTDTVMEALRRESRKG